MKFFGLIFIFWGYLGLISTGTTAPEPARIEAAETPSGYIARLLINETPFPGEHGWLSEEDTKIAMLAILWVLDSRINHIPTGYRQEHIAAVRSKDIIDVITVGGEKGQCDGFYRNSGGQFVTVPRVEDRINSLLKIAGQGKPGKFARLINYGQGLARAYISGGIKEADQFAKLSLIGKIKVTGRAYSWMANRDYYNPGGNFVKIPDADNGARGGNRFFTLKKL